jgi:hypothetical protein
MNNTFHDDLHDIANRVRVVDLYDRVLSGSRRRAWRDRTLGVTLAVVAMTAIFGVVAQLRSVGLPGPESSASAGPQPSFVPSVPPSQTPSGSPTPGASSSPGGTSADLRNITLEVAIPAGTGIGTVTDGQGQVQINALYNIKVVSAAYFPDRGIAVALLRIQAGGGSPLFRVHIYNRVTPQLADHVTIIEPDNYSVFYEATAVAARGADLVVVTVNGSELVYHRMPDGTWVKTS